MSLGNVGSVSINILGNMSGFNSSLNTARSSVTSLGSSFSSAFNFSLIYQGIDKVLNLTGQLFSSTLKTAASFEQIGIAYKTIFGDAGEVLMVQLKKYADITPYTFQEIAKVGQILGAFDYNTKQIPVIIDAIGNAVSSIGGGADDLQRLSLSLGELFFHFFLVYVAKNIYLCEPFG